MRFVLVQDIFTSHGENASASDKVQARAKWVSWPRAEICF